jgi:hypothetical protein
LKRYSKNYGNSKPVFGWCSHAVGTDDGALIVQGDESVGAGINEDEGGGRVMLWSVVIVYVTSTIEHGNP